MIQKDYCIVYVENVSKQCCKSEKNHCGRYEHWACSSEHALNGILHKWRACNGRVPDRYEVFPPALQKALRGHTSMGGGIIISGAYIGTDVWGDGIYPVEKSAAWRAESQAFVQEVLGYKWLTDHGCYNGRIEHTSSKALNLKSLKHPFEFHQSLNPDIYCVENPDGIQPADKNGTAILRYSDNGVPAAVAYDPGKYRTVSFGFPLEVLKDANIMETLLHRSVEYISEKK